MDGRTVALGGSCALMEFSLPPNASAFAGVLFLTHPSEIASERSHLKTKAFPFRGATNPETPSAIRRASALSRRATSTRTTSTRLGLYPLGAGRKSSAVSLVGFSEIHHRAGEP